MAAKDAKRTPSESIDARSKDLGGWRGETLSVSGSG
jgi:hypothetical protein